MPDHSTKFGTSHMWNVKTKRLLKGNKAINDYTSLPENVTLTTIFSTNIENFCFEHWVTLGAYGDV